MQRPPGENGGEEFLKSDLLDSVNMRSQLFQGVVFQPHRRRAAHDL